MGRGEGAPCRAPSGPGSDRDVGDAEGTSLDATEESQFLGFSSSFHVFFMFFHGFFMIFIGFSR